MATIENDPTGLAAGDLCHSITILSATASSDASGNIATYTPFLTGVRAKIDPVRGVELIRSGQDVTQTFITVTIRYVPGITSQMQVQAYHGLYSIRSIENVLERNRVLKLLCLAIGNNS